MANPQGWRDDRYSQEDRYPRPDRSETYGRRRAEPTPGDEWLSESRSFSDRDEAARRDTFESYRDGGFRGGQPRARGSLSYTPEANYFGGYAPTYGRDRPAYEPDRYTPNPREGRGDGERGLWSRTRDEVASWFGDHDSEHRRDEDAAHRGKGPKGYKRSDARIVEDVNDRLSDDAYLDASDVEVAVKDGEVTLNGYVPDRRSKRRAEDLAEHVSGVGHVQNNLRVAEHQAADYGQYRSTMAGGDARATAAGQRTPGPVKDIADGDR